eukprot:403376753
MKACQTLITRHFLRQSALPMPMKQIMNCKARQFSVTYKQPSKQALEQKQKQVTTDVISEPLNDKEILRLVMKQERHKKMFEKYEKTHCFDIKSMKELQEKVIENQYPVIVVYYQKGSYECDKLINLIKKYLGKSGGKFSLATIDISLNNDVTGNSLHAYETPTTYLMYKSSTTLEIRGYPSKLKLKELLKSALFLYQITNEENLINSLIKEGKTCIQNTDYEDALYLFTEAKMMDKWKSLYGSCIVANLAFIQARRGNMVSARQYLNEYYKVYGRDAFDQTEEENLQYVRYVLEEAEAEQDNNNDESSKSGDNTHQNPNSVEKKEIDTNIDNARELYEKNHHEKAIKISMELLKQNYDDNEAHQLLLQIFNELGSDNSLVINTRLDIKDMLLKQSRHF